MSKNDTLNAEEEARTVLTELFHKVKNLEAMQMKKENIADKDTQSEPAQPVSPSGGTAAKPDGASQDDMNKKYEENEADKDTQAEPAQTPTPKKIGTPEQTPQDNMADKYKEQEDEKKEDEVKKEQVDEEVEDETQMKEQDEMPGEETEEPNEMEKMVEILEALTKRIELIEQKVGMNAEPTAAEEPEAPVVENFNPASAIFKESSNKGIKEAVRDSILKK